MSNVRVNLGFVVGRDATINRLPGINISGGDGVTLTHNDNEFHMEADTNGIQSKLNGQPGQYISFDANGSMIPVDKPFELYGFEFDNLESNPESKIRYFGDNVNYTPARMGESSFDYGDWENAFFIKNLRPCMLNYDGTVAYDLDKNDYTKKADGTASDIADASFDGNVMVGIPTVWVKVDNTNANMPRVYISDKKIDDTYHAYAHHDNSGNIMPYTYIAAYDAQNDSTGRTRSLSGGNPLYNITLSSIIEQVRKNNPSGTDIWDVEKFVDRNLINLLLMLIGKTTNTQAAFGYGNVNGYNNPAPGSASDGRIRSGALNTAGLFWGSTSAKNMPVKVFGIENWWGNMNRLTMGLTIFNDTIYYKLTKGTEDGSSVYGFNIESLGRDVTPEGWMSYKFDTISSGYIKNIYIQQNSAMIPYIFDGTETTYMCDRISMRATTYGPLNTIAAFGGAWNEPTFGGAFCLACNHDISSFGSIGTACSCKPNAS